MRLGASLVVLAVVGSGLGISRSAEQTTVTVSFIDARNGKPYTGYKGPWQVRLFRSDPAGKDPTRAYMDANDMGTIRVLSDANGKASFTLPSPTPAVIWFESPLGCSRQTFDIREVIATGVVAKNECRTKFAKKHARFQARPGEIIYFVAPFSFWDRVNHAIFF